MRAAVWVAGLFACAGLGSLAAAVSAAPTPVQPAAAPFKLGDWQGYALRDAGNAVPNDGKTFGVGQSPAEVAAVLRAAGAPPDPIPLSVDALLLKGNGRVMLFDTGLGLPVSVLTQSLAQAGVQPGQVTDIFITHSHRDHVGGLATADGRAAFPNAVVHMSSREWAAMQANPQSASIVRAISAEVKTFEPGQPIVPGVEAVGLYGHTPGHVGYQIHSGPGHLLDMGDTAHSSIVSLARPDWIIGYDGDAEEGRSTREAELARLAQSHELVFGPHMPFPGLGHVEARGTGYVWRPAPL